MGEQSGISSDFPLTVLGDWNITDSNVSVSVYLMPSTTKLKVVPSNLTYQSGRIVGGQYVQAKVFSSIDQADQFCLSDLYCSSFTFASNEKVPTSAIQYWFSSNTQISDNSSQWKSYLLSPPRPPPPPKPTQLSGPWAALCTRLNQASTGHHIGATCLAVNQTHWQLNEWPSRALGGGELQAGANPSTGPVRWHIQTCSWCFGHNYN